MQTGEYDTLVCYVDSENKNYAVSILLSKKFQENSIKLKLELNSENQEPDSDFISFFEGDNTKLNCGMFSLIKVK